MAQGIASVVTNLFAAFTTLYGGTVGSDGQPVLVSSGLRASTSRTRSWPSA
jgi:hypothetical protein